MLHYTDQLPLEWSTDGASSGDDKQRLTTNLYVLEAVAGVEEHAPARLNEDQPEIQQELHRLDAKLQLLLDMVARLLRREDRFPRRYPVRLAVDLIEFSADIPDAAVGTPGVLSLHLHPAIPAPLLLSGRIVTESRDAQGHWLHFQPEGLSEAETEALSRHIFRHHRRSVAAARQTGPAD